MSSVPGKTCPACGARNKPKWEFCARCGESLQDVASDAPAAATAAPAEAADEDLEGFRFPTMAVLALLAVAAALFAYRERGNATPPDAAIFTIGTQPPAPRPNPAATPARDGEVAFQRGRELLAQGHAQDALPLFAEAVGDAGDNAMFRAYYGKALFAAGNRDDAVRQFQAACQLAPDTVDYRADLARALMAMDRRDDAAREYARILSTEPDHPEALRTLARLKLEQGNAGEAVDLLKHASDVRAGDVTLAQEMGYALERSGKLDEAASYYEGILSRRPDAQITRSRLAEVLVQQERPADAAEVLRQGLAHDANAAMLHRSLGSVLERSGKTAEAAAEYREYARLAPGADDAKSLEERAAALERRLTAQR